MDLSTLARVKVATGNAGGTTNDALLAQFLTEVSKVMERRMMRHAERVERTEVYPLVSGYRTFSLRGCPIDPEADLTMIASPTRDFTGGEAVEWSPNVDFLLDEESGHVDVLNLPETRVVGVGLVPAAPAYVQVTYTGGLAEDTAELLELYPDLAGACDMQVAHRLRRKDSLGATSEEQAGTKATPSAEYQLLAAVEAVCAYYRRTVFA
jgi:hypothetical protein